jgi:hypothetical protein
VTTWLIACLKKWKGTTTIRACVFPKADRIIFSDIGDTRMRDGKDWGIGAHDNDLGEFISEPWPGTILEESIVAKSLHKSTPFLEVFGGMTAVLSIAHDNQRISLMLDSVKILQKTMVQEER